jgi:ABC-type taurine transport system ATPase subunit
LNDEVRQELEVLPTDVRVRFERIVRLVEAVGLERVREPYIKHLEGRLWEMRLRGKDGIARAILCDGPRAARRDPSRVRKENAESAPP